MSTVCDCEKKGVNCGTCDSSCSKHKEFEPLGAGKDGTSDRVAPFMVAPIVASVIRGIASLLIPSALWTPSLS